MNYNSGYLLDFILIFNIKNFDLFFDGHKISHEYFSIVVLQVTNHQTSYLYVLSGVLYYHGDVECF
jgi:hypothetical protein